MSDAIREAFEAWYNEEYVRPIIPADRTEGGYQHPDAQAAWDAWQAALQQTAPVESRVAELEEHARDGHPITSCPTCLTVFDGQERALRPVAWLVWEIGEDTWFDHLPVKPGTIEAEHVRGSPIVDYCPVYAPASPLPTLPAPPVESREAIKAEALDDYANALDKVFANALEAEARDCPAWHAGQFAKDARKQAARLRASQQEGGDL